MKKKRSKISYRELRDATPGDVPDAVAPGEAPAESGTPAPDPAAADSQGEQPPRAETPDKAQAQPAPSETPAHPETPEELAARLNRRELPAAPALPSASTAAPRMKRGDPSPRPRGSEPANSTTVSRPAAPSSGNAALDSDATASRNAPATTDSPAGSSPGSPFAPTSPAVPAASPADTSLREQLRQADGLVDLLMFRVGGEIFAASLGSVEEVVEMPDVHRLPEMPDSMLGVFKLRSRLVPVYAPRHVLGVELIGAPAAALVIRSALGRIALAVNDVDDVLVLPAASFRDAPGTEDADGVLLGVASRGRDLVAIVDADALVAACVTEGITEFS